MALTIKPYLDRRQIRLRLYISQQDRTSVGLANRYAITPAQWNPAATENRANWVRPSHPLSDEINAEISARIARLRGICLELEKAGAISTAAIKAEIERPFVPDTFAPWALGHIDTLTVSEVRKASLRGLVADVAAYAPGVGFGALTPGWLDGFTAWLRTRQTRHGKPLHPNTIAQKLTYLRTLLLAADRYGKPTTAAKAIRVSKVPTAKRRLTWAEFEALEAVEVEPGSQYWWALLLFRLVVRLGGIRPGDVLRLTPSNIRDGIVTWTASKTKGKLPLAQHRPVTDAAAALFAKAQAEAPGKPDEPFFPQMRGKDLTLESKVICLPVMDRLRGYLKRLAGKAGLSEPDTINLYTARHTAAQRLYELEGKELARYGLGHAGDDITDTYLDPNRARQLADVYRRVLG